ncbi:hypothetical protein D3C87_1582940 [compost metagenome]
MKVDIAGKQFDKQSSHVGAHAIGKSRAINAVIYAWQIAARHDLGRLVAEGGCNRIQHCRLFGIDKAAMVIEADGDAVLAALIEAGPDHHDHLAFLDHANADHIARGNLVTAQARLKISGEFLRLAFRIADLGHRFCDRHGPAHGNDIVCIFSRMRCYRLGRGHRHIFFDNTGAEA